MILKCNILNRKMGGQIACHQDRQEPLLLKTNMDAGHGGASGRFKAFKETATEYAFLLDLAGKLDADLKG
jgi:protease II